MFALKKLPSGRFSAHSNERIPKRSIYLRVESIAVGVEMKTMMIKVIVCKKSRLNKKIPLLVPPRFFHIISIGSLARLIIRTSSSSPSPLYCTCASNSSNLMNVLWTRSL